jgi:hypothetical protein
MDPDPDPGCPKSSGSATHRLFILLLILPASVCMQVTPLHLMLFASRKIELLPSGLVRLDNWITLEVEPRAAAAVAALRPSLEALVIRCAAEPENIADPGHQEDRTIQVGGGGAVQYHTGGGGGGVVQYSTDRLPFFGNLLTLRTKGR